MAISLVGSGSLFQRLGILFGGVADCVAIQGGTATARVLSGASMATRVGALQTDYASGTGDVELVAGDNGFGQSATPINQAVNAWDNSFNSLYQTLKQIASNTLVKMVDRDAGGLLQRTAPGAITYLIAQMQAGIAPPVQTAPATATTGGTVPDATHYYVITAITELGETTVSNEKSQVTSGGGYSTVTINWDAVTGAIGYNIYTGSTGAEGTLVKAIASGATVTYTITGGESTTSVTPPTVSTAATSVNATTVSVGSQAAVGIPNGNPTIIVSDLDGSGEVLQYAFGETLTFTVSADAQTGGATLGQEGLTVTGQAAAANSFADNWPAGSGTTTTIYATSSGSNNSGPAPNVLQNGSFTTFSTSNVPDNWTIATGTAGTQVLSGGSGHAYVGGNSVAFVGDGSTLTAVTQQFNTAPTATVGGGGTNYKPLPLTPYAVAGWLALSGASPASGVLEVALIDGSGTVIDDEAGAANSHTVDLTAIADTDWHNFSAVFRLPAVLPATVKLRVRLSTELTSGTTAYVDALALAPMKALYVGGPFAAVFSNADALILGDAWSLSFTPTWGAVQQMFERFFGMRAQGLRLPAATSSPTVADSVIA